ncbi:MAG: YhbY family RNA-binding protein [Betaproteobacteria bacterium]|nr:YhbY family RNA-binding protein [Betaproteobacteria bacterium]MDH5286402.1 YhbY family RNA-binding protein [Betaproteobacteria bacterium]
MDELTPQRRRELRAKAHHLHPVASIGQHGLTPRVLNEIDIALTAHGLIKIRVHSDDRAAREAMLVSIAEQLHAAPVQHLGKLLIVWRERDEEEAQAPKATRKPGAKAKKSGTDRKTGPKAKKAAASRQHQAESTSPGNWRKRMATPKRLPGAEREARGAAAPADARRRRAASEPKPAPAAHPGRPRKRAPRGAVKVAPRGTFDDGMPRDEHAAVPARTARLGGKPPRGAAGAARSGKPALPRRRRSG